MPQRQLKLRVVNWPVAGVFRISRSALTEITTVIVEITENGETGRGECRPYARYDETADTVLSEIEKVKADIESGASIETLQSLLPAGAARNALDCALWDLKSRLVQKPVWSLLSCSEPQPRITAYTLSVDHIDKMEAAAKAAAQYPLLKIKVADWDSISAVERILSVRPDAKIIVDANEAFTVDALPELLDRLNHPHIALIEQPLPAGKDDFGTIDFAGKPAICADESVHNAEDLDRLWASGYRAVNIKLDKTGGLTAAHDMMVAAKAKGFTIMAGCMVASSLGMAPMMVLESFSDFIDLDGPLLLGRDIENGLIYEDATINPPTPALWGF